jgi:predicted  nucleic acid-binding Zn-ribbon protein
LIENSQIFFSLFGKTVFCESIDDTASEYNTIKWMYKWWKSNNKDISKFQQQIVDIEIKVSEVESDIYEIYHEIDFLLFSIGSNQKEIETLIIRLKEAERHLISLQDKLSFVAGKSKLFTANGCSAKSSKFFRKYCESRESIVSSQEKKKSAVPGRN